MALSASTVWEVRPTVGADTNGGGFVSGASGTDFSQQDAAQYTFTDLASTNGTNAAPIVSSASHNFVAADVGNLMNISAGTNWTAGFYQIVSVASNNATLDRACGSAATLSAGTYAVGGALATLAIAIASAVASNSVWIRATGTNVVTATLIPGSALTDISIIGYTTTRGDNGRATITTATNGVILFRFDASCGFRWLLANLNMTNTAGSRADCVKANLASNTQQGLTILNCILDGFTEGINAANAGFNAGIAGFLLIQTEIKNCSSHGVELGLSGMFAIDCFFHNNSGNGVFISSVNTSADAVFENCVFYSNTLSGLRSSVNENSQQNNLCIRNCAFVSNTLDGLRLDSGSARLLPLSINNVFYGNGGWGINSTTVLTAPGGISFNNAYGGNTSGASTGWLTEVSSVTLTANPFTSPATGDFTLNSAAGGGTLCKGAGYPTLIP